VDGVEVVDLRSVAENAWTTTTTEHARLRFDGDPGTVEADESRLTQVFENLFRNSVEHGSTDSRTESGDSVEHGADEAPRTHGRSDLDSTDDASARESADFRRGEHDALVTITVGRTDDGFYVEDDGPGIPEGERETVFEAGYSTDPEGTGFGLNIVRTIAEAHGWEVDVTAAAAGGARFEFTTTDGESNAPGAER
jgi:signal transduction histidine kinase